MSAGKHRVPLSAAHAHSLRVYLIYVLHIRRAGLAGYKQRLDTIYRDNIYLVACRSVYR